MLMFSKSLVDGFKHRNKTLRYGQALHQYAKLEKVTGQDKNFCDRLYEADEEKAKSMIASRLDRNN